MRRGTPTCVKLSRVRCVRLRERRRLRDSPALAAGSPITGCPLGCSPADLFIAPGAAGTGFLAATAAALGLAATDNLNALSLDSCLTPSGSDLDEDGVDDGCDNCTAAANPSQWDADVDGYGNACDADYTQDGVIGGPDFGVFVAGFFAGAPGPSALACAGTAGCTHTP